MTNKVLRWALIALMLLLIPLFLSSPALAETVVLDMDQMVRGNPTIPENWVTIPAAKALADETVLQYPTLQPYVLEYHPGEGWVRTDRPAEVSMFDWQRYEDESIRMHTEFLTLHPANSTIEVPASVTIVTIAHPSQMRTAMSFDTYVNHSYAQAESMATHVRAVAAVNGDFFKYHYDIGYVVRQGVFYRDKLNGRRDVLLIDSNGDFHAVYAATSDAVQAFRDGLPEDVSIVNTFTFGPVLVENGQPRRIEDTIVAKIDEFSWARSQQRVAIVQLDTLHYAIVEGGGKPDSTRGTTLQEFADLIAYLFPDCRMAYNLDGGGSTSVCVRGKRIHITLGHRAISDILYFASAVVQ